MYSNLTFESIEFGYKNTVINTISLYTISQFKLHTIFEKKKLAVQYLDNNIINEYDGILLSKSKTSVIEMTLQESLALQHYKIIPTVINNKLQNTIAVLISTHNRWYSTQPTRQQPEFQQNGHDCGSYDCCASKHDTETTKKDVLNL